MRSARLAAGFSLLEMLVAIAILALSLGALYQAVSGATRNIRSDEQYAYGVELARSLLADNAVVPLQGHSAAGETAGGFRWRVNSIPLEGVAEEFEPGLLQDIEVVVSWQDGERRRQVLLQSVVAGVAQ